MNTTASKVFREKKILWVSALTDRNTEYTRVITNEGNRVYFKENGAQLSILS
jgi:hypothetical protein